MLNIFELSNPVLRQYALIVVLNLHVICLGLSSAWGSPSLIKLRDANEIVLDEPITEDQGSWVVSIGILVALGVIFFVGFLLDKLGRKAVLVLSAVPRIVSGLILVFSRGLWWLLFARAMDGIANACLFGSFPLYASEISSKQIRGSMGTIFQICSSLGVVIMLGVGPFVSYLTLNVMCLGLGIGTAIPLLFLPESPYYLHAKGKNDDARRLLIFLRGSEVLANEELKEYSIDKKPEKADLKSLFSDRLFIKALVIGMVLAVGIQFNGGNAVLFYLQTILVTAQTTVKPEISSIIVGLIQLTASVCTPFMIDRSGRKPLLIGTSVLMIVGLLCLGAFFKVQEAGDVSGFLNYVPLISIILVIFGFSCGPSSVFWLLLPELFDGPARAGGTAICLATCFISLFVSAKYFPALTLAVGPAIAYWILCLACTFLTLFICFFVPETKGKSIAEIQDALCGTKRSEKEAT